jgi:hypothetical protein
MARSSTPSQTAYGRSSRRRRASTPAPDALDVAPGPQRASRRAGRGTAPRRAPSPGSRGRGRKAQPRAAGTRAGARQPEVMLSHRPATTSRSSGVPVRRTPRSPPSPGRRSCGRSSAPPRLLGTIPEDAPARGTDVAHRRHAPGPARGPSPPPAVAGAPPQRRHRRSWLGPELSDPRRPPAGLSMSAGRAGHRACTPTRVCPAITASRFCLDVVKTLRYGS